MPKASPKAKVPRTVATLIGKAIRLATTPRSKAATAPEPQQPFWRTKTMAEMSPREWESLCDGCGRCCLNKLTDVDTNETVYTDVGCKLLDGQTCRCVDYKNRQAKVSDCVRLTPRNVKRLTWLPPTCGYRLIADGRDLYWWHPLVSGDPDTVHSSGISVRGKVAASEKDVPDERLVDFIVRWPGQWPKGTRASAPPSQAKKGRGAKGAPGK